MLNEDEGAIQDLSEASRLVPDDQQVAAELTKVRQRKEKKRAKEREAYKKMFA
jgi:peptidyl-prolyl isomerase D